MTRLRSLAWTAVLGGCGAAVLVWRHRGSAAVGRVAALAVIPSVVFLRPPLAVAGAQPVPLEHGELRACRSAWSVGLDGNVDPRVAAEVTERLWELGLGRVSFVFAASATTGARDLAEGLDADLVPRGPPDGTASAPGGVSEAESAC